MHELRRSTPETEVPGRPIVEIYAHTQTEVGGVELVSIPFTGPGIDMSHREPELERTVRSSFREEVQPTRPHGESIVAQSPTTRASDGTIFVSVPGPVAVIRLNREHSRKMPNP